MKKYCSITPDFPKDGFILSLFVINDGPKGVITLRDLYTDVDRAGDDVIQLVSSIEMSTASIPPESVLTYFTFERLVPLERGYWTKPSVHYGTLDRNEAFTKMAIKPGLYKALVVPTLLEENNQRLEAVLPLPSDDPKIIETFMQTSDQVVDERAKYAAIYTFSKTMRFNWETKEVTDVIPHEGQN